MQRELSFAEMAARSEEIGTLDGGLRLPRFPTLLLGQQSGLVDIVHGRVETVGVVFTVDGGKQYELPLRGNAVGELHLQAVDAVLLQLAELGTAFEGHFELFAHFGKGLGLQGQANQANTKEEKQEDTYHGNRIMIGAKVNNKST